MRWIGLVVSIQLAVGSASLGQTQGQAQPKPRGEPSGAAIRNQNGNIRSADTPEQIARMDALLQRWEAVSQNNQTLYAQFERTDTTKFGTKQIYVGEALFKKPNLACLEWKQVVTTEKGEEKTIFTERIVCAGDRVYQMIGPTKQVMVYSLPQDERRRALEEGPVPFLFNMRMAQAKARYRWRLLLEQPADPAKGTAACYFVEIEPLQKIDMEEFSRAWVRLDQESLLPESLKLFLPNGDDTRTYRFSGLERNGPQNKANNPENYNGAAMAEKFREYGYKIYLNANPGGPEARPAQLGAQPADPKQKRR